MQAAGEASITQLGTNGVGGPSPFSTICTDWLVVGSAPRLSCLLIGTVWCIDVAYCVAGAASHWVCGAAYIQLVSSPRPGDTAGTCNLKTYVDHHRRPRAHCLGTYGVSAPEAQPGTENSPPRECRLFALCVRRAKPPFNPKILMRVRRT
jgi:hypothetical protein